MKNPDYYSMNRRCEDPLYYSFLVKEIAQLRPVDEYYTFAWFEDPHLRLVMQTGYGHKISDFTIKNSNKMQMIFQTFFDYYILKSTRI